MKKTKNGKPTNNAAAPHKKSQETAGVILIRMCVRASSELFLGRLGYVVVATSLLLLAQHQKAVPSAAAQPLYCQTRPCISHKFVEVPSIQLVELTTIRSKAQLYNSSSRPKISRKLSSILATLVRGSTRSRTSLQGTRWTMGSLLAESYMIITTRWSMRWLVVQ